MKYIINKTIIFDSNKLALCLYENNQIVTRLTKPATRLLLELILKSRVSISREDLLERVWNAYGFTASNAGLNNYISELRKAFMSLGYENELIITLPKQGFRFEADIDLFDPNIVNAELTSSASEDSLVSDTNEQAQKPPMKTSIYDAISSSRRRLIYIFSASIFLVATLGFIILKPTHQDNVVYQKFTKVDNCDIYLVENMINKNELSEKIDTVLKQEDIDCKNIPGDVFYLEDRLNKNTIRADLITVCRKAQANHYDICFNIKTQRNTSK